MANVFLFDCIVVHSKHLHGNVQRCAAVHSTIRNMLLYMVFDESWIFAFGSRVSVAHFRRTGNGISIHDPGLITFGALVDAPYALWEIPLFMVRKPSAMYIHHTFV